MDFLLYIKYLVGLIFVLGLIALVTYGIRRFGLIPGIEAKSKGKNRLRISQMIPVDAKRRLLLVRRDDTEHLILLGPDGDTLVETGIAARNKETAMPNEKQSGSDEITATNDSPDETAEIDEPRLPIPLRSHKGDGQ